MDIQEFFYIAASIALVLISVTIIAVFYLIIRIKQTVGILAQTWGRLTLTRVFLRFLKLII